MSRVAKKPISLPKGVEVNITAESVSVKGPKGALSLASLPGVSAKVEGGVLTLHPASDDAIAMTGTARAILANSRAWRAPRQSSRSPPTASRGRPPGG